MGMHVLGLMTTAVGTQLHLSNERNWRPYSDSAMISSVPNLQQQHGVLAPASSVSLMLFTLLLVKMSGLQKAVDEDGIEGKVAVR